MTNSGTEKEGGQQAGIGPAAAAKCGPAALVGAALLALVGLVVEAGVVERQAVAAAALGRPPGGRARAAAGRLAAERGGGSASIPEGRLQARSSPSGSGGLLQGLSHPELVAALDEFLRHHEGPRVDQVTDVARQFTEEEGGLCILHRLRLQGGEVIPQGGGPGVAAHGVIQPLVGYLLGAEAVGPQEELLQLLVRVADGGGVPR